MKALVVGLAETGIAVTRRLDAEGWAVSVIEDTPVRTARYRDRVAAIAALGVELLEAPDDATVRGVATQADIVVPSLADLGEPGRAPVPQALQRTESGRVKR